jgi:hypothetical protein
MALKLDYYGQNDGTTVPNVTLVGDPGTDQATLTTAGFLGGKIMAIVGRASDGSPTIAPCDQATMVAYGALLNGPGEFAGAIGPSGSKKAPVVRAMFKGSVSSESYVASPSAAYAVGQALYCATGNTNKGLYTSDKPTGSLITALGYAPVIAINTHAPTAAEPWLGVASLI